MTEIKSTMEMVMERAARMAEGAGFDPAGGDLEKQGMKQAAAFMQGNEEDLTTLIGASPEAERNSVRRGMVRTLLRNIFLPREEDQQETAEKAMNGLVQVGAGSSQLQALFAEMKKILDQYLQHRRQLRGQLEENFKQQMQQMQENMAQQVGANIKLDPAAHPKFQEEWQRVTTELNSQYGKALDQYKSHIEQSLLQ